MTDNRFSLARAVLVGGLALQLLLTLAMVFVHMGVGPGEYLRDLGRGTTDAVSSGVVLLVLLLLVAPAAQGRRWALALAVLVHLALALSSFTYAAQSFAHPEVLSRWALNVTYPLVGAVAAGFGVVAILERMGCLRPAVAPGGGALSGQGALLLGVTALWSGMLLVAGAVSLAPPATGVLQAPAHEVRLIASDTLWFSPRELSIQAGRRTAVVLVNRSAEAHSFDIDSLGVHVRMPARSTTVVLLGPQRRGAIPFHCGVPGHAPAGMTGTLRVM